MKRKKSKDLPGPVWLSIRRYIEVCTSPALLVAEQVYVPASLTTALNITKIPRSTKYCAEGRTILPLLYHWILGFDPDLLTALHFKYTVSATSAVLFWGIIVNTGRARHKSYANEQMQWILTNNIKIYKISCLTHSVPCLYQAMQTRLWRHSMFPSLILEKKKKMDALSLYNLMQTLERGWSNLKVLM